MALSRPARLAATPRANATSPRVAPVWGRSAPSMCPRPRELNAGQRRSESAMPPTAAAAVSVPTPHARRSKPRAARPAATTVHAWAASALNSAKEAAARAAVTVAGAARAALLVAAARAATLLAAAALAAGVLVAAADTR